MKIHEPIIRKDTHLEAWGPKWRAPLFTVTCPEPTCRLRKIRRPGTWSRNIHGWFDLVFSCTPHYPPGRDDCTRIWAERYMLPYPSAEWDETPIVGLPDQDLRALHDGLDRYREHWEQTLDKQVGSTPTLDPTARAGLDLASLVARVLSQPPLERPDTNP